VIVEVLCGAWKVKNNPSKTYIRNIIKLRERSIGITETRQKGHGADEATDVVFPRRRSQEQRGRDFSQGFASTHLNKGFCISIIKVFHLLWSKGVFIQVVGLLDR
jgi:hypothetical protein